MLLLFYLLQIVHQTSSQGAPDPQHKFWGYNDFNSDGDLQPWTQNKVEVCNTPECDQAKIRIRGNDGYIYRTKSVNTIGYHHITIQFTLDSSGNDPLENGELAKVQYNIDDKTSNWITLESYDNDDMTPYITANIELPVNATNNNGVRIRFKNTGDSYDNDAFYISGALSLTATIITNDPTTDPTNVPTNAPTIGPTNQPTYSTNAPTIPPTINPTLTPTIDPSVQPTTHPTNYPTENPTNNPTSQPSTDPTKKPTLVVIIMDPTVSPTHILTSESTQITDAILTSE
eukprot:354263_1